jgi:hypothetical protein
MVAGPTKVVLQGWLQPDPNNYYSESEWRNETWMEIVPCDWHRWCGEINGFDCSQVGVRVWCGLSD